MVGGNNVMGRILTNLSFFSGVGLIAIRTFCYSIV